MIIDNWYQSLVIIDGDGKDIIDDDDNDDDGSPHSGYIWVRRVGGVVGGLAGPGK